MYDGAEVSNWVITETAAIKLDACKVSAGEGTEGDREQQYVAMRVRGENPCALKAMLCTLGKYFIYSGQAQPYGSLRL